MNSSFIWADLSTLDINDAKRFYKKCFGWEFHDIGDGYLMCEAKSKHAAGIYTMPEKFQRIGMPCFWMSYIRVEDINETVRTAEKCGAIIEVHPEAAPSGGLVALIRDPAGAGFTCYQGDDLGGKSERAHESTMVWNELHVSSLEKVESFYTQVFNWNISPTDDEGRYDIHTTSGHLVGGIRVYGNDIKGDKEYWGVFFSVANLRKTTEEIKREGGRVIVQQTIAGETTALAYDSQGAAFFLLESAA